MWRGGAGAPAPDAGYAVTTLVQLPPGGGVVMAATVDQDQGVVGDTVTITATITADGLPVTGAARLATPDVPRAAGRTRRLRGCRGFHRTRRGRRCPRWGSP